MRTALPFPIKINFGVCIGLRPSAETRRLSDSSGFVLSDGCEPGEIGFELDRGFVAERGMQSASVIDVFDPCVTARPGPCRDEEPAPRSPSRASAAAPACD